MAIKELHETCSYCVSSLCRIACITRSAYYRWKDSPRSRNELENEGLLRRFQEMHEEHPDMGHRRLADRLERDTGKHITDKRALRICRKGHISSKTKWKPKSCTRGDRNPYHIAENVLDRNFTAEAPNRKWCTDISEFKYYKPGNSYEVAGKLYLSAFIDLYDKRIVSFVISDRNDNELVMKTFDKAVGKEKDAHPMLHSDRGFQYTSRAFRKRIESHDMVQSMSRVGRCIDNAPMEGFWGLMKREMYYGRRFRDREELLKAMKDYIRYYNGKRIQRKLDRLTPLEFHNAYLLVA